MLRGLWERLHAARRLGLYAGLALAALLLLVGSKGVDRAQSTPVRTELELRMERLLSRIDGVGSVSAMISQDEAGAVVGVVIVADGLRDIGAYLRLESAATTLLDIDAQRVRIIGGGDGFGGDT